uniref:hypothetical protein n=1 Tax=Streptomyces sp. GbtcB6 TaxID=2824751 RepID=UPI001C2F4E89
PLLVEILMHMCNTNVTTFKSYKTGQPNMMLKAKGASITKDYAINVMLIGACPTLSGRQICPSGATLCHLELLQQHNTLARTY